MRSIVLSLVLLLVACGRRGYERVAGVTRNETDALNDAAEMLYPNEVAAAPFGTNTADGNGAEEIRPVDRVL